MYFNSSLIPMRRQFPDSMLGHEHLHDDDGYHRVIKRHRQNYNKTPPPGWMNCLPFGTKIGYLIPSKVPLDESFYDSIIPTKRYSHCHVLDQVKLKIGMIIDLTNSNEYYDPKDWTKQGIKHVKIASKGHDSVPENEDVNTFVYEVSQFLEKRPGEHVLVHCTHGHNRTGYMIVHYLMRTWPVSVAEAVKIFSDRRPPGIYKADYIDALYEFYHEKKPCDTIVYPLTPEWKRSSNSSDLVNGYDHQGKCVAVVEEKKLVLMTNDDVLGDKIPSEQEIELRRFCYDALKLNGGGGHRFPGSHPVSLDWDNLQLLRQRYYYATWKADGTRYMMLIMKDGCFLIDRHFNFRRVQMRFPSKESHHHFTLLDGEMVIDTMPGSNKQQRRYLIYDMMAVDKVSIIERPFNERWKMIEKEVIEPRNIERKQNSCYRYELEPFRVRRKDFWQLPTVRKLLKSFIPKLSHAADGLIFQGRNDPYVPRTHEGLLKWKYPEMNSVDFLFELVDDRPLLYLHERGRKRLMEGINRVVFPANGPHALACNGKIVEFSWNSEERVWVCMRVRPDKGAPNEFNTYMKVMRSIRDNITEELLLNEIHEIIRLPMYASNGIRT